MLYLYNWTYSHFHSLKITRQHDLYKVFPSVREGECPLGNWQEGQQFYRNPGPLGFWAYSSFPKTEGRSAGETSREGSRRIRPERKCKPSKRASSPSLAAPCRCGLLDGVSLHPEKPPLTQAFCSMQPVTVSVTVHPSVMSPTLAHPAGL